MIERIDDLNTNPQGLAALELEEGERTRCEVWTRVMGYHRPLAAWNPGKQSEHAERRYFAAIEQ